MWCGMSKDADIVCCGRPCSPSLCPSSCLDDEELQYLGAPWDEYSRTADELGLDVLRFVVFTCPLGTPPDDDMCTGYPRRRASRPPTLQALTTISTDLSLHTHCRAYQSSYTVAEAWGAPVWLPAAGR